MGREARARAKTKQEGPGWIPAHFLHELNAIAEGVFDDNNGRTGTIFIAGVPDDRTIITQVTTRAKPRCSPAFRAVYRKKKVPCYGVISEVWVNDIGPLKPCDDPTRREEIMLALVGSLPGERLVASREIIRPWDSGRCNGVGSSRTKT